MKDLYLTRKYEENILALCLENRHYMKSDVFLQLASSAPKSHLLYKGQLNAIDATQFLVESRASYLNYDIILKTDNFKRRTQKELARMIFKYSIYY